MMYTGWQAKRSKTRVRLRQNLTRMGLLTVIRKSQRKEREMRVLFLCGQINDSLGQNSDG